MSRTSIFLRTMAAAFGLAAAIPAQADLRVSELIVDLGSQEHSRDDLEVWNDSPDRSYVVATPRQLLDPGRDPQSSRIDPDPEKLGLLVSPSKMILEPGQRRLLRIAALSGPGDQERVFRVTVKPVTGALQAKSSGIKILVGYDLLVLVRPVIPKADVSAVRRGQSLLFTNHGNVSVEFIDGRQCDQGRKSCSALGGKRLYVGSSWTVDLPPGHSAEFTLRSPGKEERRTF